MDKISLGGVLLAIGGALLFLFKIIGSATSTNFTAADWIIEDALSTSTLDSIDALQIAFLHDTVVGIITTPLFILMIVIGIIMAVVGGFVSK